MTRISAVVSLLLLIGCADQSKGAALNECRLKYYLESPAAQAARIPDCMATKSFEMATDCSAETNEHEWDWQIIAFAYDNPKCYQAHGSNASIATLLSPM